MSTKKYSRRDFIKGSLGIGTLLTIGSLGSNSWYRHLKRDIRTDLHKKYLDTIQPPKNLNSLPNIVIILADDLGYGDLSSYGNTSFSTPNVDQLAADGTRLSNFYASAPLCSPSRAGLLTGRYPVRTMVTSAFYPSGSLMNPVLDIVGYYSYGVRGIPEDEVLIPEILKRRGYQTGIIGKWHLGDHSPHLPLERGFDEFYGAYYSNDTSHYQIIRNTEIELDHPVDQDQLTSFMTIEAVRFLRENSKKPFFLYLAHPMPHEPIHASKTIRGTTEGGLYGDSVTEIDWSVGEIVNTLEELKLSDNTILFFTSDNGPWWQGNPGFTRGRKILAFEGGFKVPFIVKWPGKIPAHKTIEGMSMNFDIFPTCLEIAGVDIPRDRIIDGCSLVPLLTASVKDIHNTLYYFKAKELLAVRQASWKYYRRNTTDNAGYWPLSQGPFLFNLDNDPNESYSMIESESSVAKNLSDLMDQFEGRIDENLRGWL